MMLYAIERGLNIDRKHVPFLSSEAIFLYSTFVL